MAPCLPPPPYHLSRHLITVSSGDANSTLMFPFVRVSCQSPQRGNNYRQLFLLIIFLTLARDWLIHHTELGLEKRHMPTVNQCGCHFVSIKKICNVNYHVFCSSKQPSFLPKSCLFWWADSTNTTLRTLPLQHESLKAVPCASDALLFPEPAAGQGEGWGGVERVFPPKAWRLKML
jgi:hypothetical protein